MDWIKVEHGLPDKPEVIAIAARLNLDQDAVATKCIRIWVWFERNTQDGNAKGVTKAFLDRLVSTIGFADAMFDAGWLEFADGVVIVPKFAKHLGMEAKRRAQSSTRVRNHRMKRKCNATSVTGDERPLLDNDLQQDQKHGGGRGGSAHTSDIALSPEGRRSSRKVVLDDLVFPKTMDTPEVRKAMEEWLQYKRARNEAYVKAAFVQKAIDSFVPLGADAFVTSVNRCIGSNYAGLFPAKEVGGGKPRDNAGSVFDPGATG